MKLYLPLNIENIEVYTNKDYLVHINETETYSTKLTFKKIYFTLC